MAIRKDRNPLNGDGSLAFELSRKMRREAANSMRSSKYLACIARLGQNSSCVLWDITSTRVKELPCQSSLKLHAGPSTAFRSIRGGQLLSATAAKTRPVLGSKGPAVVSPASGRERTHRTPRARGAVCIRNACDQCFALLSASTASDHFEETKNPRTRFLRWPS